MCSYSSRKRLSAHFHSPSTRSRAQIGPLPRGRAPTSTIDKVGAFAPAQQMAVTAVPKCLLSEPGRDVEGQAEGSALLFLSPSMRGGPGRSGAAVFPAQQVRTLIGSDTDVQNCQGASASPLSGVVPVNTPRSPLTSQAPGVLVCSLPHFLCTPKHT